MAMSAGMLTFLQLVYTHLSIAHGGVTVDAAMAGERRSEEANPASYADGASLTGLREDGACDAILRGQCGAACWGAVLPQQRALCSRAASAALRGRAQVGHQGAGHATAYGTY